MRFGGVRCGCLSILKGREREALVLNHIDRFSAESAVLSLWWVLVFEG